MAFEFGSPPQWWQESKTWKQKNPNQQQQKEKCGSKPVLLVEGPGSKWWNALLSVSTAPDCRAEWPLPVLTAVLEFIGWLWAGGLQRLGSRQSVCLSGGDRGSFWASRSLCCEVECMWLCQAFNIEDEGVAFKNNIFFTWNKLRQRVRQLETDILFSHLSRELYFQPAL